jgi:hypothetical protein
MQAPHLMSSLLLPLAHGQSPAPSAELRRALRLALAEVPGKIVALPFSG